LNEESEQPAPSYNGLFKYKKETFHPPMILGRSHLPEKACIITEGEVPVMAVPVRGEKGFIYMGPVRRAPLNVIKMLEGLGEKTGPLLETLVELDKKKNQVEAVLSSGKAVQNVSSMIMNEDGILKSIVDISVRAIGASGGMFIKKYNNMCSVISSEGLSSDITELLNKNPELNSRLLETAVTDEILIIYKGQSEYFELPQQICAIGAETVLIVGVNSSTSSGAAVFWYDSRENVEEYKLTALLVLTARIADILNSRTKIMQLSGSYGETLKVIAQTMDQLSPYTMGYSELMYRYATVIAYELKLSNEEIYDIGLAAYLSNIGIIGLSSDLYFKEGKYTELEYEMMKLHSDVGASIVEATMANNRVASYIRYHHERVDGYGYPEGLKGEEIPLGARIIAVVQTFLAKVKGRMYREPLSFEESLEVLKVSAGTQLDPKIVDAFIGWFRKKQSNPERRGKSLGECWELNCSPESVCSKCLVYKRQERNCWEYEINNCKEHGSKCSSCYVYTEYLSRHKV
jgi:HD-GYP domain-containing protein (c-di-GMP phosphodiesterase class II)